MPHLDPIPLIRFHCMNKYNGLNQRATKTDWTDEGKFIIKLIITGEELATQNDIIDKYNKKNGEGWEFYILLKRNTWSLANHFMVEKRVQLKSMMLQ